MIDANRKASITLKNGLKISSITVNPSLYLSNGLRYRLNPVTLDASGTAVININEALRKQGISSWATLSGYVEIEYVWAWDPLCVSVTSVDPVHSTIFTSGFEPSVVEDLRFRMSKPKIGDKFAVDGMWWKPEPGITGFIGLSNTTTEAIDARVQVSDDKSNLISEYTTRISPHGTKIVSLGALREVPANSSGGLRVLHTGKTEGLLINGILEDESTGYSANLPFHYDFIGAPQSEDPELYAELGLMAGTADPMMRFPAGTVFAPFSVVRNVSDQPVSITPTVYWMQNAGAHSARLPSTTLLPGETQDLAPSSMLATSGLASFNGSINLLLEAAGKPHALLFASGSVDQKNTYVFQVLAHGVQESIAKTISYWSTDSGDDTMVTVWNPADESQDYRFTLLFAGGHYQLPIHLEPRATRTFNISEIIANQIPDEEGNIIPAAVHEGSARIAGAHADNEDILVAIDAGTYNVRKATCSYYCISCDGEVLAFVNVTPFAMAKSGKRQLSFTAQNNNGTQYSSTGTWGSTNTGVATVSAQNNGLNGLVTGIASGTSSLWAQGFGSVYSSSYCAYDPSCPYNTNYQGSGTGTVVVATISIRDSGAAATDDAARDAYKSETGTYNLGTFVGTNGFCSIGYEAAGSITPTSYTGTINLVRTKGGAVYTGSTGQTLQTSYPNGTNDTSPPQLEDTNPHSGTSNGTVYDLDAPGTSPAVSQVGRIRYNFFENAQLPDGTYVATEIGFYVRVSCNWGSAGNSFRTEFSGDNTLGLGTTKTTWNLQ